jgi:hypothetical protein
MKLFPPLALNTSAMLPSTMAQGCASRARREAIEVDRALGGKRQGQAVIAACF